MNHIKVHGVHVAVAPVVKETFHPAAGWLLLSVNFLLGTEVSIPRLSQNQAHKIHSVDALAHVIVLQLRSTSESLNKLHAEPIAQPHKYTSWTHLIFWIIARPHLYHLCQIIWFLSMTKLMSKVTNPTAPICAHLRGIWPLVQLQHFLFLAGGTSVGVTCSWLMLMCTLRWLRRNQ